MCLSYKIAMAWLWFFRYLEQLVCCIPNFSCCVGFLNNWTHILFSNCSPAMCVNCYLAWQESSITATLPALHAQVTVIWNIYASVSACNLWAFALTQPKPGCLRLRERQYRSRRMQSCCLMMSVVMPRWELLDVCY